MAETEPEVTQIRPRLPAKVVITTEYTPQFTPRELQMIKEQTGRSYTAIVQDDESDERLTVTAWLKLRREGYEVSFEDMQDVLIEMTAAQPDPTNAGRLSS